jgi:hypothetical protein
MSYDYISVEEVYRIWREAMRVVNKDDKYILSANYKFDFELQVEKYQIQRYSKNQLKDTVYGAKVLRNGKTIISIEKWGKLLQRYAKYSKTESIVNNPDTKRSFYSRKWSHFWRNREDKTDRDIPYGMVNPPPTGGIAKKDLG